MQKKRWRVYIPEILVPEEPQMEILERIARIETGAPKGEADLIAKISRSDAVLITSRIAMTRKVLEACPRLKIIGKYGVGIENIDVRAATELGIPVVNVAGGNTNAVAELALGLILAVLRGIQDGKNYIAAGRWRDERFMGNELAGTRVGIIGYGAIAKSVIRKLQGFEVQEILAFSESRGREKPEFPNTVLTDLRHLLRKSDIVTIHKSLTPKSKGLIGREEINLMKKTAYLINTSRGALVDEKALITAMREGRIAGAALDVFDQEPLPQDHPFLSLDKIVLTPHIAASTRKGRLHMVITAALNVADFLEGKGIKRQYLVNREVYRSGR